ncbi:hypothetical protein BDV25DRAFT_134845 [Aspergillus avenaceus]|uniref:Uncharacterized protein n=1 Tax=Aspergillus avenaceus TaxID=36643 RepID=A0A5N6TCX8_ASPAV|nr:hypothetical protein BDV25DRAFT_134845 [Aspergillus avenaceus]
MAWCLGATDDGFVHTTPGNRVDIEIRPKPEWPEKDMIKNEPTDDILAMDEYPVPYGSPEDPSLRSRTLSSLDPGALGSDDASFYFGVLALQKNLLPKFCYRCTRLWGVRLTLYGHTIVRSHVYKSQKEARTDVCREALKRLSVDYSDWIIPDIPVDSSTSTFDRDWVKLLSAYCVLNGLPKPEYIKFVQGNDYLHTAKMNDGSHFGLRGCYYKSEYDSQNAVAHQLLHALLVSDDTNENDPPRPLTVTTFSRDCVGSLPRVSASKGEDKVTKRPPNVDLNYEGSVGKRRRKSKGMGSMNSNLVPLSNCRVSPVEISTEKEEPMWKLQSREIQDQLWGLKSHAEKLERVCHLLSLEYPGVTSKRMDGRLMEAEGEYTAAAYFRHHPYLVRVGAIGQVKSYTTEVAIREACAQKVVEYLIEMVKEDMGA